MKIEKIHIDSFMGKRDFTLELASGINILRGDNESGKSTVAEFIKFMLYGASARGVDGAMPERQKYLPFGDTAFGGSMELTTAKGHFGIHRTVTAGGNGFRESLTVTDLDKRSQVYKGENAGEALLGLPETVFSKVAYISQEGEGYTGGEELSAAIENLLFSADETVSTDKALKKLDALRVSLLHKNGKGGQLFEMEKEREGLQARLEKALGENSEIIAKEGSLLDTERRIAENKTEYTRTRKLCELYDRYIAHTRFAALDEATAAREAVQAKQTTLSTTFGGFAPDGEYLGRLRHTAEEMRVAREAVNAADAAHENARKARAAAENAVVEGENEALAADAKRAQSAGKVISALRIGAIALFVLAALAACGVYLFRLSATLYLAAGGVAVLGAVLLCLVLVQKKRVAAILAEHGVSTAYALVEQLRDRQDAGTRVKEALAKAKEEEHAAFALCRREEERLSTLEAAFRAEAERLQSEGTDADALFAAIEAYIAEDARLSAEDKRLGDRIAELERATAAYDREEIEKMLSAVGDLTVFEKLDITEYSRKRDFCENAISALEIKRGELEKSLAALRATVELPALLKAALDELCKKEAAAKTKYAAAELAARSIENASAGLRTRVSPRLAEYAGKLLAVMTDGKYSALGVDGEMALTFLCDGAAHSAEYLSKGTRESAYFALRLALADLLCKEEKLPLILDESFAHTDDTRTKQMLRILTALAAEGTQSLILTCHTREEKIADAVGAANLIVL